MEKILKVLVEKGFKNVDLFIDKEELKIHVEKGENAVQIDCKENGKLDVGIFVDGEDMGFSFGVTKNKALKIVSVLD